MHSGIGSLETGIRNWESGDLGLGAEIEMINDK